MGLPSIAGRPTIGVQVSPVAAPSRILAIEPNLLHESTEVLCAIASSRFHADRCVQREPLPSGVCFVRLSLLHGLVDTRSEAIAAQT